MEARKICIHDAPDILRWGHTTKGVFSIKEAYTLKAIHHWLNKEEIWNKIWKANLWPKVNTFLWLLVQNKILTWENFLKRGFTGPSIFPLCQHQEETTEHLLNQCDFSLQIWEHVTHSMYTSDRDPNNIKNTIEKWRNQAFKNPILNRIWKLLPGFIVWKLWKERNRRIFQTTSTL
jgi:hypothetical protein